MGKKRTLAVLLALCMTLGTLPMAVFAGEQMPEEIVTEEKDAENNYSEEENKENDGSEGEEADDSGLDTAPNDKLSCTKTEDCPAEEHEAGCPKTEDKADTDIDENTDIDEAADKDSEEVDEEQPPKKKAMFGARIDGEAEVYNITITVGAGQECETVQAALDKINSEANEGEKALIRLEGDADSCNTSYTYKQDKENIKITIDLNGSTLKKTDSSLYFGVYAIPPTDPDWKRASVIDITIMDSSEAGTGTCEIPIYIRYGKLTIKNGNYTNRIENYGGKLTIEDGNFDYTGRYPLIDNIAIRTDAGFAELTIEKGSFNWKYTGSGSITMIDSDITVAMGNPTCHNVTINGGRFICDGGGAINFHANIGKLSISGEDTYFEMTNANSTPLILCAGNGSISGGTYIADGKAPERFGKNRGDLALEFSRQAGVQEEPTATFDITGGAFDGRIGGYTPGAVMNISGGSFDYTNTKNGNCSATYALIYIQDGCILNVTDWESISVPQMNSDGEYNYKIGVGGSEAVVNLTGVDLMGEERDDPSGGILIENDGKAVLEDCVVSGNSAGYGGGICMTYGSLELKGDSKITGNSADYGGGICIYSGLLEMKGASEITGNHAIYGGGVYLGSGEISMDDSVIFCNNTARDGGADIWYTKNVASVSLPDAAGMGQEYLADGKGRTIDGWYLDYPQRYIPSIDGVPYDYKNDIGNHNVLLVASYKDAPREANYYVEHYQEQLDGSYTLYEKETLTGTIDEEASAPVKDYGHYHVNEDTSQLSGTVSGTDALTLKIYYDLDTNTVSYDLGGGDADGEDYSDLEVKYGYTLTVKDGPKKSGYKFTGWNTSLDGTGTTYQPNTLLSVDGDTVLYAQWEKIKDSKPGGSTSLPMVERSKDKEDVPELNKEDHFAYVTGYPDGNFRPERNMTRAEVAVMFSNLILEDEEQNIYYGNTFTDVLPGEWYYDRVGFMERYGIINGYPDGTFRPNEPITRAEFATIAAKFDELKETGGAYFPDLPYDHWGRKFIEMAYNRGWISGYPDGSVKPDRYVTRAEVVSITNRMLERICDREYVESHRMIIRDYFDITNVHWAYYDIMEASNGHTYERHKESEDWIELS